MKKDNMLNESTIRRFMKLATIGSHTDKFVKEALKETSEETVEEAAEEEIEEATEETVEEATDELDEMGEVPMGPPEEEEIEMELPLDAAPEEPAASGMVSIDQLMSALERALEDVLGQDVEVSQDDELETDDAEAEDMAALDMEPMGDMGSEEEEEEDLEETTVKSDIAEEVYARVVERLTKRTKRTKRTKSNK